jgi:hypothetical protein
MRCEVEPLTHYNVPKNVLAQKVVSETVLVDLNEGNYFELNELGSEVFDHLQKHGSVARAVDDLIERYDVERPVLEKDINALLLQLERNGLLQRNTQPLPTR